MSDKPVINPPVPYVGPLQNGIGPGRFVRILGVASPTGRGFACNLQCGSSTFDDIAVQVSVPLDDNRIVLNSQEHGVWNEAQSFTNSQITRGQQFEILVICEATVFKIGINGQHLCEFPHKVPYYRISHIRIEGDVSVSRISVESQPSVPSPNDYTGTMNAPPPPYAATTMSQPQMMPQSHMIPPPLNAAPQTVVYPPGAYVSAPLLQQPVNTAALNAVPRNYQPPFWHRSRYGFPGNSKMLPIIFVAIGVVSVAFLVIGLIIFFKSEQEYEESIRRYEEEFHKNKFGNRR